MKQREGGHDLPQKTGPVQVMRAFGMVMFAGALAFAVACLVTGRIALAVLALAVALVEASLIVSQTRFINDRRAGRPFPKPRT